MKVVYADSYDIPIEGHPWPTEKYRRLLQRILADGLVTERDVLHSQPAAEEDVLAIHSLAYIEKLESFSLSPEEEARLELPFTTAVVNLYWHFADGTILAAKDAVADGVCFHIGGGMHHAFPNYGSGFCILNDLAIGARYALEHGLAERILIVDCDLHQGDGTAYIFAGEERVFTFSMHQRLGFPYPKQKSDLDIPLPDGTGDDEYVRLLDEALDRIFVEGPRFDLILYQAGADPYAGDPLGSLALSMDGLRKRDELVFERAKAHGIPVAITLGGGYAPDPDDVVQIHFNTAQAAHTILT